MAGYYNVFWFFTCLFTTQVLFAILNLALRDKRLVVAAVAVAYVLAHVESGLLLQHPYPVFWDADVSLLAMTYYAIGYFCKQKLATIPPGVTLAAGVVSFLV